MVTASFTPQRRFVLTDLLAGSALTQGALVVGGAATIAVMSQIAIPLGFTPVPLSLGTLGVLVTAGALGPWRGVGATVLYLVAGLAGLPVFAQGGSGWGFASFGYIVGYIVAAAIVGELARRRADRRILRTALLGVAGTVAIYSVGLPWLMLSTGTNFATALQLGVIPFLLGDSLKIAITAGILPASWSLVGKLAGNPDLR